MKHSYKTSVFVSRTETWTEPTKTLQNILFFSEWLTSSNKFDKHITDMSKTEMDSCLKSFYTSAPQKDGSFYKKTMKSIRAAIDRYLRLPPNNKEVLLFRKKCCPQCFCKRPKKANNNNKENYFTSNLTVYINVCQLGSG